jgi:outer membrane receptor protein involved in Fe transport
MHAHSMRPAHLCDRKPGRFRYFVLSLALFSIPFATFADEASELPIIEADPVTVTSTRTPRSVLDVAGNVTVIDRERIERSSAQSIADVLRREAGLFVTNSTGHAEGTTIEARGFNNGGGNGCSTLVLVDGRPVNEPDTGCPDWSFLPLENAERIEIVRGPVSAAWGSGAIGGVIHIHTRDAGGTDGIRAGVRGHGGTYSTDGVSAHVSGRSGPIRASAFHETNESDSFRDRADYRSETTEASLGVDLGEDLRVDLRGGISSRRSERPGAIDLLTISNRRAPQTSGADGAVRRQRFLSASLQWDALDNLRVTVRPHHRQSKSSGLLTGTFTGGSFEFASESEVDTLGIDAQAEWAGEVAGRPVQILAGVVVAQDDIDGTSLSTTFFPPFSPSLDSGASSARRKTTAGFLQAEISVSDDVLVSLGARRDRSRLEGFSRAIPAFGAPSVFDESVRQTAWSPRASVTWRFHEKGSAYAAFSRGVRFPNLFETFGSFGFSPGLRPEKSKSYEIGGKWREEGLELNASIYHSVVSDEIYFVFDPNRFTPGPFGGNSYFGDNENVDRVRHRGLELSGRIQLCEWLEAYSSYTYDDVEIRNQDSFGAGERIPITPKHRGTLGFDATLPFGFEAGINANYVGSRFVANSLGGGVGDLGKYATYDARLGWATDLGDGIRFQLDAIGHNLTDREYTEFAGFSTFSQFIGFFPAPDRHYTLAFRFTIER